MDATAAAAAGLVRRRRLQLLLIAAVFVLPLALAAGLYYAGVDFAPRGRVNQGDPVTPARRLPAVTLLTATGTPVGPQFMRGSWSLVYVASDGVCDSRCNDALATARAVQLALGRDMMRVERVLLIDGACCATAFPGDPPKVHAAWLASPESRQLLTPFAAAHVGDPTTGRLYLVDPLGNLLLSYAAGAGPRGPLVDLRRLLQVSQIG